MWSMSKTDSFADRSILALLSVYQAYPVTLNLMTSQVVQRAWNLSALICALGTQRVKAFVGWASNHLELESCPYPNSLHLFSHSVFSGPPCKPNICPFCKTLPVLNKIKRNLQWHIHRVAIRPLIPDRIVIWSVGFCGGRKAVEPRGIKPS